MRLKYNCEDDNGGLIILEAEPQLRNIFITSQIRSNRRIAFPRLLFVIKYHKKHGRFIYAGLFGLGLHVFGIDKPLKSLDDKIIYLPVEKTRNGLSCTEHYYDGTEYNSKEELANFVITLWWSLKHNIDYEPNTLHNYTNSKNYVKTNFNTLKFVDLSLNDLNSVNWYYGDSLKNQLSGGYGYKSYISDYLNGSIIDENWGKKAELKPLKEKPKVATPKVKVAKPKVKVAKVKVKDEVAKAKPKVKLAKVKVKDEVDPVALLALLQDFLKRLKNN